MTAEDKARQLKRQLRLYMNGATAQSQRDKGLSYRFSWGVSLQHLQELAAEYGKDSELASLLWESEVRECRLLATLIMPPEDMTAELAETWLTQARTQELAEFLCFNLIRHVASARSLAFRSLSAADPLRRLCAYSLLGQLFSRPPMPTADEQRQFLRHVRADLQDAANPSVRYAALRALRRFALIGEEQEQAASNAARGAGIDVLL